MKALKIFHAFVGVWHEKGNQYNVSNYTFYVVCGSEKRAKQMINKEVKTFRYWKHNTSLEEIKGDKEKLRELSWQGLTDKIFNAALAAQIGTNEEKNKKLQDCIEDKGYYKATVIPILECLKDPEYFYSVLKELSSASKVMIVDSKLHIYEIRKNAPEGLFKIELKKEKRELLEEARKGVEEAFKGVLEKLNVLGT